MLFIFVQPTHNPVAVAVLVAEVGGLVDGEGHGGVARDEVILDVPQQPEQAHAAPGHQGFELSK